MIDSKNTSYFMQHLIISYNIYTYTARKILARNKKYDIIGIAYND